MPNFLPKKSENQIGLIGHTIIGYPTLDEGRKIISALVENGADLIELQIPFSEPVADGPLFSYANHQAIEQGITVDTCFKFIKEITSEFDIPFVIMTYINIVFKMGYEKFIKSAIQSGIKGAIVPDLPFEYEKDYLQLAQQNDFAVIPVIPPNMHETRMQSCCTKSSGFIYMQARSGVTGARTQLDKELIHRISQIRKVSDLPIAVGFGISSVKDVEYLKPYADYAIVGTETLRQYEKEGLKGVKHLWGNLASAK